MTLDDALARVHNAQNTGQQLRQSVALCDKVSDNVAKFSIPRPWYNVRIPGFPLKR